MFSFITKHLFYLFKHYNLSSSLFHCTITNSMDNYENHFYLFLFIINLHFLQSSMNTVREKGRYCIKIGFPIMTSRK